MASTDAPTFTSCDYIARYKEINTLIFTNPSVASARTHWATCYSPSLTANFSREVQSHDEFQAHTLALMALCDRITIAYEMLIENCGIVASVEVVTFVRKDGRVDRSRQVKWLEFGADGTEDERRVRGHYEVFERFRASDGVLEGMGGFGEIKHLEKMN